MRVVVIHPDRIEERDIDGSLESIKEIVGGWLEALPALHGDFMYVNEEGATHGLPINPVATMVADIGQYVRGPAVLMHKPRPGDENAAEQPAVSCASCAGLGCETCNGEGRALL